MMDRYLDGLDADEDEAPRREIAPGRVPATIYLPPRPIQQILFRAAAPAPSDARDGNGVARDADLAVARAASSSGQALPDDLRARFEHSLGADLSGVRIHTGADSASAAAAVGARAYTVGQDIHFADGLYAPGDPFGLHLLAHEVAHTVQQAGGAQRRQHKLEVSSPGDSAEREADRAADAMVAGARAEVTGGPTIAARDPAPGTPPGNGQPAPGGAPAGQKPVADTVELTSFNFSKGGGVTAKPDAKGISIDAPPIHLTAEVKVKDAIQGDDLKAIGTIKVGSVQNLTASERTGVYTKPDGTVAVEYRASAGAMADAQWQDGKKASDPKVRDAGAAAPFYQTPDELNPSRLNATAKMDDQPGFAIPSQMSGGTLTEIKGQDSFVTSAAAKRDGDLVHLKQEAWTVPWAMKVDPSMTGKGQDVDAKETTDKPTVNDGTLAINSPDWFKFKTVADAKAAPISTLLSALAVSRSKDPDNFQICVQAVKELNWHFTVTVRCNHKYNLIMKDHVDLVVAGASGTYTKSMELGRGDSDTASFNFGTIFDPASWQDGSSIKFTLNVEGHTLTVSQAPPWTGSEGTVAMPGSDGHYNIGLVRG